MTSPKLENPFKYSEDPSLNRIFDELQRIKLEKEELKAKAQRVSGFEDAFKFKPLKSVDISALDFYKLKSLVSYQWNNSVDLEKLNTLTEHTIKKVTEQIESAKAENVQAIEHNLKIQKYIEGVMESLGIGSAYSTWELPNSRSKNKKEVRHVAGWLLDLRRVTPKTNIHEAEDKIKRLRESVSGFIQSETKKRAQDKEEQDKEELSELISKHPDIFSVLKEINPDIDLKKRLDNREKSRVNSVVRNAIDDCLELILSKNKYLYLAYYLEKNRNDWHEGPDYAQTGLNNFEVATAQDQAIYDEINGLISDWEGDGRCFRDCTYSYSFIYGLVVDGKLLSDLQKLQELESSFNN